MIDVDYFPIRLQARPIRFINRHSVRLLPCLYYAILRNALAVVFKQLSSPTSAQGTLSGLPRRRIRVGEVRLQTRHRRCVPILASSDPETAARWFVSEVKRIAALSKSRRISWSPWSNAACLRRRSGDGQAVRM